MGSENQVVTKKEFYSVSSTICFMILFAFLVASSESGWPQLVITLGLLLLAVYYQYKAHFSSEPHPRKIIEES